MKKMDVDSKLIKFIELDGNAFEGYAIDLARVNIRTGETEQSGLPISYEYDLEIMTESGKIVHLTYPNSKTRKSFREILNQILSNFDDASWIGTEDDVEYVKGKIIRYNDFANILCDEDTKTNEVNSYLSYLEKWYKEHQEGEPCCFEEFLSNEYIEISFKEEK